MANLVGKTLGKYEIRELLGKGGMAEVYKAYHPKLERYVTIKVLHSFLAEGEDFLARFEREARAGQGSSMLIAH
jgi:serine/threonine protein kinase